MEEIIELAGQRNGQISIILVGVHGNERCGIEALERLWPNLLLDRGRVFVAYGNPVAIQQKARFIKLNLNRMFKDDVLLTDQEKQSYEYSRARFLKKYLDLADASLDIHASLTPKSKPFAICEANAKGIVEYLPFDLVVSGFDELEPGATDGYMNSVGKIGICVECGYMGDPQSARIAEESISTFLKARGHIANNKSARKQSYIRMYDIYITKTNSFALSKPFDDFEQVSKGQVIGVDGGKRVLAERDGVILFARNRERVGDEAFLIGEKKNSLA